MRRTGTSPPARAQNWLANPEGRAGLLWSKDANGQLQSFNLYRYAIDHDGGPIFSHGDNQGYSANLHGGNDITRYYLSSTYDDDGGVVVLELGQEVRRARQRRHRGQ